MKWAHAKACALDASGCWATSSSLGIPVYLHHGPIQACRSAKIPRHAHGAAHCIPDGPRRANWLTIAVHEVGPYEGLFNRRFWLLWADTSSSETSVHSHRGPMRSF